MDSCCYGIIIIFANFGEGYDYINYWSMDFIEWEYCVLNEGKVFPVCVSLSLSVCVCVWGGELPTAAAAGACCCKLVQLL